MTSEEIAIFERLKALGAAIETLNLVGGFRRHPGAGAPRVNNIRALIHREMRLLDRDAKDIARQKVSIE
jgi:hypothetical protein